VEQEPEAIVLEVAEAVADALDLLHEQVHGLGGSVGEAGAVPAQDLVLPAAHGGGEAAEFVDFGSAALGVEAVEPPAGLAQGVGGVNLAEQFLGEVGGADLAGRVTKVEAGLDASPLSVSRSWATSSWRRMR
jgi:hypothetical protein